MGKSSATKITRRDFVGAAIGAAAVGAEALRPTSQVYGAQVSAGSNRTAAVDQNPIRRRGTGLRGLDAARTSAGLTLFAPMLGDGTVYLIDLQGNVVHTWEMPYRPGLVRLSNGRGHALLRRKDT